MAEAARADDSDPRVFAAVASLQSGRLSNEVILEQTRATDEWSYFQGKGNKLVTRTAEMEILPGDALVLPSIAEGMPNVVLEAQRRVRAPNRFTLPPLLPPGYDEDRSHRSVTARSLLNLVRCLDSAKEPHTEHGWTLAVDATVDCQ